MTHHRPSLLFRDVIFNALLMFVAATLILWPHINPPTTPSSEIPPGTLSLEIRWPDHQNTDIDIWVKAPGDEVVSFKRKHGKVFDLLRDDTGTRMDDLGLNYENAYTRGLPDGQYIINIHYYRGAVPVPVEWRIAVRQSNNAPLSWSGTNELETTRMENTLLRIRVEDGQVIDVDDYHEPLVVYR